MHSGMAEQSQSVNSRALRCELTTLEPPRSTIELNQQNELSFLRNDTPERKKLSTHTHAIMVHELQSKLKGLVRESACRQLR